MTDLPKPPGTGGTIQFVQVMRGVAALAVVFFHTHVILALPESGGFDVFGRLAVNGWLGVNLFFVISGFIILYAHGKDIGHPERLPRYAWRRFSRLYPLYWLLLSAFILAAAMHFGPTNFKWEVVHLVSAYSLVAFVDTPTLPLKVAWTLLFEVKFYAIFAILLVWPRTGVAIIVLWATSILTRNSVSPPPDWGYFAEGWGLLHMWNINFLCGLVACLAIGKLRPRQGAALLGAGVVALVTLLAAVDGGMEETADRPWVLLLFALTFSMIITGGVLCERRYEWVASRWASLIGDASYSIYLVHSAAISALGRLSVKLQAGPLPATVLFIGIFLGAIVFGLLVHLLLERPLLGIFRNSSLAKPRL